MDDFDFLDDDILDEEDLDFNDLPLDDEFIRTHFNTIPDNGVIENFPFVEDDVDAITDYELFSKGFGYLDDKKADKEELSEYAKKSEIPDVSDFVTKDTTELENYTLTSSLSSVATSGSYNDLSNKPNIPPNMTILSYGSSTWNDFITAYNSNSVVYCRASSNSNPATGSQTRLAFMAYVNNSSTPTEVEFQYYRSVSTHSDSQQGDQVFIYKLTSSGTWSVLTRNTFSKVVAGTNLSSSYSNGVITLNNTLTVPTIESISQSDFINTVGSGVTIAQFNVCHIGKYISGTIQLQYSSDIVNSDTYPFSIKNYIPVNGYVSYCALGSTQWKIESPGYIYIDPSRWVLKNDTGRTGLRWATISFSYMII